MNAKYVQHAVGTAVALIFGFAVFASGSALAAGSASGTTDVAKDKEVQSSDAQPVETKPADKDATPTEDEDEPGMTLEIIWGDGLDCAVCHEDEAASMEDAALLAPAHAAFDCNLCHNQEDVALVHEKVSEPPDKDQARALRKKGRTMGTSEFCLRCHGSLEELAEQTLDVTIVQDMKGTVVNPHAIPVNEAHAEAGVQECSNCHWLHKQSPSANGNCTSCHHAGVYECGTCHEIR